MKIRYLPPLLFLKFNMYGRMYVVHGLRTPGDEIVFTARPKTHSHSQIFSYGRSIFCLPHRPKFSDFFDFCLHWVSVVRALEGVVSKVVAHHAKLLTQWNELILNQYFYHISLKWWIFSLFISLYWKSPKIAEICWLEIDFDTLAKNFSSMLIIGQKWI